jgi:hypothetical protein
VLCDDVCMCAQRVRCVPVSLPALPADQLEIGRPRAVCRPDANLTAVAAAVASDTTPITNNTVLVAAALGGAVDCNYPALSTVPLTCAVSAITNVSTALKQASMSTSLASLVQSIKNAYSTVDPSAIAAASECEAKVAEAAVVARVKTVLTLDVCTQCLTGPGIVVELEPLFSQQVNGVADDAVLLIARACNRRRVTCDVGCQRRCTRTCRSRSTTRCFSTARICRLQLV